jgi:ATP-dependent DNA ligase
MPTVHDYRLPGMTTLDDWHRLLQGMQWVTPELVAQIRFVEWTAEGRLRHAAFLRLRSDKSTREVRRE